MRFFGRSRLQTRAVMAHWTGAENAPSAMFKNMNEHMNAYGAKSPLSIHFAVSQPGAIYQLADTDMRAIHCKGGPNDWAIGIEFIGRGSALDKVPHRGVARARVTETIHAQRVTYDELTSPQIESGVALIAWLCHQYTLPLRVPEDAHGLVRTERLTAPPDAKVGVIGHMHYETKSDPGLRLLRAVQQRGRSLAVG